MNEFHDEEFSDEFYGGEPEQGGLDYRTYTNSQSSKLLANFKIAPLTLKYPTSQELSPQN